MLFIENVPNTASARWDDGDRAACGVAGAVNAGHWYDGVTLYLKRWFGFIAYDPELGKMAYGPWAVKRYFTEHLGRIRKAGIDSMDGAPTLIGEFGLPYDLNGAFAYKSGDYRLHVKALSAYYDAMDENLLSATIWNYTASNTHARGDGWNGEDLSIWCRDDFEAGRTETGDPADAGGRALAGVVRPYARATAGVPSLMRFDRRSGRFVLEYEPGLQAAGAGSGATGLAGDRAGQETEVYLPELQYPKGFGVSVSGGTHRLEDRHGYTMLSVRATPGTVNCRVVVERR